MATLSALKSTETVNSCIKKNGRMITIFSQKYSKGDTIFFHSMFFATILE